MQLQFENSTTDGNYCCITPGPHANWAMAWSHSINAVITWNQTVSGENSSYDANNVLCDGSDQREERRERKSRQNQD